MATQTIVDMVLQVQSTGAQPVGNRNAVATTVMKPEGQTVAAAQVHAEKTEVSRDEMESIVSQLKDYVQGMQRDMDFHVDDVTGRVVVQVIDSSSNEVIRQIPAEEILAIARHLADALESNEPKGFFIELKA